jgi:hypothetical protein
MSRNSGHDEADCDNVGKQCLQIDIYGSPGRQFHGKKSQSIKFGPEAIDELRRLLQNEFSPKL